MAMAERGEAISVYDLLPPEIWYQILTNLPVKSILRCRSVCKTWYSLISSPHFITDHAAQTLNHSTTNRVLVRRGDLRGNPEKLSSHDESFVESPEPDDLPEQFRRGRIVGSCNGLFCLVEVDRHTLSGALVHSFLIWNPSIRKSVQLPFRSSSPDNPMAYLLGFGFDSESGDYKVLRFGGLDLISQRTQFGVSEIFDLREGVWRGISPPIIPRYVKRPDASLYFHGSLHWVGYEDRDHPSLVIVSFNLSSEVSKEIGMPDDADFKDIRALDRYSISVNNGLLSVALLRMQQGDASQDCCSVWSMKEYGVTESWTKLFSIELPYMRGHLGLLRFWDNGEVMIALHKDDFLVLYNPENRTSKVLLSGSVDEFIFQVCCYKESLVLL